MISGIKKNVENKIVGVLTQYPRLEKAIVYGSRAKNNHSNGSDIDLALVGAGLDFQTLLQIDNKIDNLLLPYKVDLCLYDRLNDTSFKNEIKTSGNVVYQKS